jgi:hypothetical protein
MIFLSRPRWCAMTLANQLDMKREAEKRLLDSVMERCTKLVESMRAAKPAEAERSKARLDEIVKATPKLPMEFKRKIVANARTFECFANMRAADEALKLAWEKARRDELIERNRLVGEARGFCNKAASLGAEQGFKAAATRKIEIIMMTGGVEHKGPTVAKPLSVAPKAPNAAKA